MFRPRAIGNLPARLGVAFASAAMTVVLAAPSFADDALQCFRIKDPQRLKGVVDIDTSAFGLAAGCKIGKAKQYCVPASSSVQSATASGVPISLLDIGGPPVGAKICYKVRCPKTDKTQEEVSDLFGNRNVQKIKAQTLCVSAVAGPPETPVLGMCTLPPSEALAVADFVPVCYAGGGDPSGTIRGSQSSGVASLNVFGIYGETGVPAGTTTLHVAKQGPAVLVLAAYENTNWVVTADPGADIEQIVVVGYEEQSVDAPAGVPVTNLSPYLVAIDAGFEVAGGGDLIVPDEWPSAEADEFIAAAEAYTGLCLQTYYYCHGGGELVLPDF